MKRLRHFDEMNLSRSVVPRLALTKDSANVSHSLDLFNRIRYVSYPDEIGHPCDTRIAE